MRDGSRRTPHVMRTLRKPGFDVELAVSPLAGMKGAAGYHSSIIVAAEEYFFSPMGIIHSPTITSHKQNPEMKLMHMGLSRYSGMDLMEFLDQYFPPGHYDLLRKNCNSFSDCALYFLCEQRLDLKFRSLERLGKLADEHSGIIQSISAGEYAPNPRAVGFDVEHVIDEIRAERENVENQEETEEDVEFSTRGADRNVFARDDLFLSRLAANGRYHDPQECAKTEKLCPEQSVVPPQSNLPSKGHEMFVSYPAKDIAVDSKSGALCVEKDQVGDLSPPPRCNSTLPRWQAECCEQGLIGGA